MANVDAVLATLRETGFVVLDGVVPPPVVDAIRRALENEREEARVRGILFNLFNRLNPDHFVHLARNQRVLEFVDATLDRTCIVFSFNAVPLFPGSQGTMSQFHRDSGRFIPGYEYAYNAFFAIDDFTKSNGGTLIVPRSHRIESRPSDSEIDANRVQIEMARGSAILFNSNLWHASGENKTQRTRWGVNVTYVRSFMRQQFDFPRAVRAEIVERVDERMRQLMGFFVRVPTSLEEYFLRAEERLYRPGQG